jgi:hypothetical protein
MNFVGIGDVCRMDVIPCHGAATGREARVNKAEIVLTTISQWSAITLYI